MKLLFAIFRYFPHGGLQCDMLRIAETAAKRGHSITICTMEWQGPPPPAGVTVEIFPMCGLSNHTRAKNFAEQLQRFRAGQKFDYVFGFNRIPGLDFYFAADNCFARSAARHGALALTLLPRYRTFLAFERAIFSPESKTHIFYLTSTQRQDFIELYGTQLERFTLLPPGISADRKRPPNANEIRKRKRAELGISEEQTLLLEVGSSFHTKGVDRTLRALAALPKAVAATTRLFIAGREKSTTFTALATELKLNDIVTFGGARDDVPELLLAADLLIHPARNEAAGAVLVESLAAGTPVLCTANCGYANFVAESGGAVLPDPFDEKEFLELIETILTSLGRLENMKKSAITYGENADFYRRADMVVDLLEEVADGGTH